MVKRHILPLAMLAGLAGAAISAASAVFDGICSAFHDALMSIVSTFEPDMVKLEAELADARQKQRAPTSNGKARAAFVGAAQARNFVVMLRSIGSPATA